MNIHPLWYICITLRLIMSVIITKFKRMNFILLIIAIGFLYQSIFSSNNEIQFEKVFWHETRIIHSFLYLCAFISMYNNIKIKNYNLTSLILVCDVIVSISFRHIYNL